MAEPVDRTGAPVSAEPSTPAPAAPARQRLRLNADFVREVLMIVVGVLIALAIGKAAEWVHWRLEVRSGREELHHEIAANDEFFAYRVAVAPCVSRQLDRLDRVIETAASHQQQPPLKTNNLGFGAPLPDDVWRSQQAAQTLTHFPHDELMRLSTYYTQMAGIRTWVESEENAWAGLQVASGRTDTLAAEDIARLRVDLELARHLESLISVTAQRQLDRASELGVEKVRANPADVADSCRTP